MTAAEIAGKVGGTIAIGTGGEASLEERMGCGCGICYGCTCRTSGGPKRICKDGPVFKKEDIIW